MKLKSPAAALYRGSLALLLLHATTAGAAPINSTPSRDAQPRAAAAAPPEGLRPAGSPAPQAPEARTAWQEGLKLLDQGQLDGAAQQLEAAQRLEPTNPAVTVAMADLALRRGDTKAAEALLGKAVQQAPQSAEAAAARGRLAAGQRRTAEAEAELKRAIKLDPRFLAPQLDLADFYLALNRVDDAVAAFKGAMATNPQHAGAAFGLGRALVAKGDLPGALRAMESSAALAPRLTRPLLGQAQVLVGLKRHDDALARIDQAAKLVPANDSAVASARVQVLWAAGRKVDAINEQRRLAGLLAGAEAAAAQVQLASLLTAAEQPLEAETALRKAVDIEPRFHAAWNNLAWLAVQRKTGLERAQEDIQRALALAPQDANYHDTLGSVLLARGDAAKAVDAYTKATQLAPKVPLNHYHLARALEQQGQPQRAVSAYQAALALQQPFAEQDDARRRLAALKTAKP